MSFFASPSLQHFIDAFCIMLLHSLWQGLLFALAGAAVLYVRASARLKYVTLLVLSLLFICTCSLTFWWYFQQGSFFSAALTPEAASTYNAPGVIARCLLLTASNADFIFLMWCLCFSFCLAKTLVYFSYFDALRKHNIVNTPQFWVDRIDHLCHKLGIRTKVSLIESAKINVPFVLGYFKPVILFPVGLLAGLPPEQVEAMLLHELAHIRRNDYLINLCQNIAEGLFFFNPGFLLLSSWIRSQREHCCDDIAITHTPNGKDYLLALVDFKGHALKTNYGLAFTGHNNELLGRVSRMLGRPYKKISSKESTLLLVSLLGIMALAGLHFISPFTLHSKPEKVGPAMVMQVQKLVNDLNVGLHVALKDEHIHPKRGKVKFQRHIKPTNEVNTLAVAQAPIITEIAKGERASQPGAQRLSSYEADMEHYHNNLAQYDKNIKQYKLEMEQYQIDQAAYKVTMEMYRQEMKERNVSLLADE